jgi:HAD superfamily hydrolase (TIGR01509 family)
MDGWLLGRGLIDAPGSFSSVYMAVNREASEPFISHTYGEPGFFARTFARMGLSRPTPEAALLEYRRYLGDRLRLDPAAAPALRWLREQGLRTALVTNESVARVDAFLARAEGAALFDEVIVSQAVGREKPDPAIFRVTLERLGLRGQEAAMLGDNEVADGACRALGMPFVLVRAFKRAGWGWERGASHAPDLVIDRVDVESMQRVLRHFAADRSSQESRCDYPDTLRGGAV